MDTSAPAEQPKTVAIIDTGDGIASAVAATIAEGGDLQLSDTPSEPVPIPEDVKPAGPPKQLTEKEFRMLRRIYVTVRHNTVEPCGDKLDINREPRNNCPYCWFVFFNSHGELVQTADEVFQKEGRDALVSLKGTKFVKNFLKFMATLAVMKEQLEAQQAANKEQDEQGVRSADGVSSASEVSSGSSDGGIVPGSAETANDGREVESVSGSEGRTGQAVPDEQLNSPAWQ